MLSVCKVKLAAAISFQKAVARKGPPINRISGSETQTGQAMSGQHDCVPVTVPSQEYI